MTESVRAAAEQTALLEHRIRDRPGDFRVLTGDRPTGQLHIGHYFGTLHNRVRLQRLGVPITILIADYQVITDRDRPERLAAFAEELVADYLACGIDPEEATIFAHSAVPELNQLLLPFLSLVSVAELRRNPTVKEEIEAAGRGSVSGLMFTYPAHQAADILFGKANLVPVGKDQLPHLELTRLIARRFNERYAPIFPVPDALLSPAPLLLGIDGQKMSKSRANTIPLAATADQTAALIRRARTDADRTVTYDPELRPEVSNLVLIAALCLGREPEAVAAGIGSGGAEALKRTVTEALNEQLRPLRERRTALLQDRAYLRKIVRRGNETARALATDTLGQVRDAMQMSY